MSEQIQATLTQQRLRIKLILLSFTIAVGLLAIVLQLLLSQNMISVTAFSVAAVMVFPSWGLCLKARERSSVDASALVGFAIFAFMGMATTNGLLDPVGALAFIHFPVTTSIVFSERLRWLVWSFTTLLLAVALYGAGADWWSFFQNAGEENASSHGFVYILIYVFNISLSVFMYTRLRIAGNASLDQAFDELISAQDKQQRMFGIIAHELRTPAAAIDMMLNNPELRDVRDEAEHRAAIEQMMSASSHLLSVIDDLRVAINPEEQIQLHNAPFLLRNLAGDVGRQMAPLFLEYDFGLEIELGAHLDVEVLGDDYRLRAVLTNLLRNACLHSGGKTAWLVLEATRSEPGHVDISLRVEDDGTGIPESELERLYEAFERGVSMRGGTGVGLHIVKSWVSLMGGEISYQPSRHGGACFDVSVTLPEVESTLNARMATDNPSGVRATTEGLRVLLVEDEPVLRKLTARQLRQEFGLNVVVAGNGEEALAVLADEWVDLIITDYFMPGMDGRALLGAVAKLDNPPPVVAITAATIGAELEELLAAGADAALSKPLDASKLAEVLQTLQQQGRLSAA